ncbi:MULTISPECIES: hypothetical protein [unclassified Sphingobium]|uniref:hypothetical protein n=1 Tax=unclassified Sphingobium TaxID=2611147 RepID=UPI0035A697E4
MQNDQPQGLFDRWRGRLAQTLLREPAVVLIDRDADALLRVAEATKQAREISETLR